MSEPTIPQTYYFLVPGKPVPVRVVLSPEAGVWLGTLSHPDLPPAASSLRAMKAATALGQAYQAIAVAFDVLGVQLLPDHVPGGTTEQAVAVVDDEARAEQVRQEERLLAAEQIARHVRALVKRANGLWPGALKFARAMIGLDEGAAAREKAAITLYESAVADLTPLLEVLDPAQGRKAPVGKPKG